MDQGDIERMRSMKNAHMRNEESAEQTFKAREVIGWTLAEMIKAKARGEELTFGQLIEQFNQEYKDDVR